MRSPRLHIITDDATLARPSFDDTATAILETAGPRAAMHVRGHRTPAGLLHERASALVRTAVRTGSVVLVNDRADIALTSGAHGVQLGRRSAPIACVRQLLPAATIGYSAHGADEVLAADSDGADFVMLGAIWDTPTHPAARAAGPALIEVVAARTPADIVAIGGITPRRVAEIAAAGGAGVAVLSGIWSAADPVAALESYLNALGVFVPAS